MTARNEQGLVSALEAIRHQLTVGDAAEGDTRDIAWCARTAGAALDAYRAPSLTERDHALEAIRGALKKFADVALQRDPVLLEKAQEALASPDREACVTFLRVHLVSATDRSWLQAETPTQQKSIHGHYKEARYRLSVLDHLDWRPHYRAWAGDGAVFDEDKFQRMVADGGFRGISADKAKQIYWQDVLDHVLQNRFYAVRNALRGPGRVVDDGAGERSIPFSIDGANCLLVTGFDHVGAGRNVAGLYHTVQQLLPQSRKGDGTFAYETRDVIRIDDHMAMDSADMAEFIRRQAGDAIKAWCARESSLRDLDAMVSEALKEDDPYTGGYSDAIESLLLALRDHVAPEVLREAVTTALDAYVNNAPEPDGVGPTPGH